MRQPGLVAEYRNLEVWVAIGDRRTGATCRCPALSCSSIVWNGVHWDFMLEIGDVLCDLGHRCADRCRSEDLPARRLGDHRRVYLEYEGPVSGDRGNVRRVDSGTYRMLSSGRPSTFARLVNGSQLVGVVDLRAVGLGSGKTGSWIFRIGNLD